MPMMQVEKIGVGLRTKDYKQANCVRAFLGNTVDEEKHLSHLEEVVELQCSIDDMTGEAMGYTVQNLLQEGALDVYTQSVQMKKQRPGVLLTCLCTKELEEKLVAVIFQSTTTLGLKRKVVQRYCLQRQEEIIATNFGDVKVKTSVGWGTKNRKYEHDELIKISKQQGIPMKQLVDEIREI